MNDYQSYLQEKQRKDLYKAVLQGDSEGATKIIKLFKESSCIELLNYSLKEDTDDNFLHLCAHDNKHQILKEFLEAGLSVFINNKNVVCYLASYKYFSMEGRH